MHHLRLATPPFCCLRGDFQAKMLHWPRAKVTHPIVFSKPDVLNQGKSARVFFLRKISRSAFFLYCTINPYIKVLLKHFQTAIDLSSENGSIKLFLDGAVEPFTNAIGLRAFSLSLGMINIFNCQI